MIDKGTAEQALEWAFNHMPDATMDTDTFMRDWERGDLDEYPDFFGWLGAQLPPVIPPLVSAVVPHKPNPTFEQLLKGARVENARGRGPVNCTYILAAQAKAYPRTCAKCGLGPCAFQDDLLRAAEE